MGINDSIGNRSGKEWETTCMGMGMALIPMGINSHRQMLRLAYVLARKKKDTVFVKVEYHSAYILCSLRCSVMITAGRDKF